jgi:hypothetical protein
VALFVEGLGLLALLAPLFVLLSVAAYMVFAFLIQFAIIELALSNKGAIECIKSSMAKVRKNWLVVLGFDILAFMISLAIGVVSSVAQQAIGFLGVLAIVNIALVLLVGLLAVILMLITTIVTAMATVPAFYYFWRSLK